MKLILLFIGLLTINTVNAKEYFSEDKIIQFLTEENPFVYATLGKEYIYREKKMYYLGDFDTKLSAKYDKKDYPISYGEFFDVTLEKPLENGTEFILGYRDAEGIQEYNNIKTGADGEVRAGMKIPVFSVLNDISTRKLNLYSASLDAKKFSYNSKDNLRLLYFKIVSVYSELLYSKAILELEQELLDVAKKRELIISKRVKLGSLADISLLEATQQIINRKQRLVSAKNIFSNTFINFLKYLNITKEKFEEQYILPSMEEIKEQYIDIESSIDMALEKRPDLKVFDYEIKKMNLEEKHANLLKYPNLNISLYGVHDFKYENGFKIAIDMGFPIERRKYEGKHAEIKKSIKNLENTKEKIVIDVKIKLTNTINSLKHIAINIKNSKDEVELVEKLEDAENKKYRLGLSTLFMVNQREIYTLEIKKKLLKYNLTYLLLQQEVNREIGNTFSVNIK